ncbi:serine/threonine-protein kinase [Streptomyces thermolilacinus]|uniref:Serine/threonine protein kinase n=1 Tax=Streptomyces thermolilacinus SPC6 TaxID=1306406 RepID=A0A1D3DN01_9ACTN|nr:serine/threonine-protein kinase [Streptomyces thermolilacinus]OEJ93699.1 serine/threonine protein kinase [Streptomyces thermolilacinus SPC6]
MSGGQHHGGTVFQPLEEEDPRSVAGYRLAARLGAGGMGKVYLSYTPGGRPVAIKVIRPDFAQDAEFRRRFAQEVQAAQRVQGLYTAPVIDADTDAREPWLATAYVPGPSLADAVQKHGPMPVDTVLLLVAGIAEALQVIHGAGIVHRDLKPGNVLLASDGPRVIDFGIARAADATSLTSSGVTIGTPAFMAPEQAAGSTVTPATDVFALGQVAAYAALGSPAFGEGTSHGVLYRIVHEEPSLDGLPEQLRELVSRCMAKDPAARPSIAEVLTMCHRASDQTALRRPEEWLPGAVAADITTRAAAPAPAAATTPPPPATPPTGQAQTPAGHAQGGPAEQAPAAGHATPPPTHPATAHAAPSAPPQGFGPPPTMGPGHAPTPPPQPHPYTHPVVGAAPYGPGAPGAPAPAAPAPAPKRNGRAVLVAIAAVVAFAVAGGVTAYAILKDNGKEQGPGQAQGTISGAPKPSAGADTTGQGEGEQAGQGTGTGADAGAGGGTPSQGTPGGEPATPPQPVDYKGIDLTEGYELSLADDPVKPKGDGGDIRYSISGLHANDAGRLVMLRNGQEGTLRTCLDETRYTTSIEDSQMTRGSRVCLQNGAGDVALLTVLGFSPENDPSDYISLDVTVWRGAMDVEQSS